MVPFIYIDQLRSGVFFPISGTCQPGGIQTVSRPWKHGRLMDFSQENHGKLVSSDFCIRINSETKHPELSSHLLPPSSPPDAFNHGLPAWMCENLVYRRPSRRVRLRHLRHQGRRLLAHFAPPARELELGLLLRDLLAERHCLVSSPSVPPRRRGVAVIPRVRSRSAQSAQRVDWIRA